jgi:hypothetical protein
MMQHHRAQHSVEVNIGEWQGLGKPAFENNLDAGLSRLLACSGNHLRRSVDPIDRAPRPHLPLGDHRKGACSAAYIQNSLAG